MAKKQPMNQEQPMQLSGVVALEAMKTMPEASAPTKRAIAMAEEVYGAVFWTLPPSSIECTPTRNGGVLVEWQDEMWENEIQVDPDGGLEFVRANKATGTVETRRLERGKR